MILARWALASAALCSLAVASSTAFANTTEDLQGVGARANAMGGAGTALSGDFTAAYYNPAGLTHCTDDHVSVDIRHTLYNLHVRRIGADAPPGSPKPLRDQTRITTGFCFGLPYHLAFGMSLGIGLQNTMSLDATGPNTRPQFAMYGETLEQLSIALGVAYEPIPQISLGFGGSILVNTDLSFAASVPIAQDQNGDGYSDPLSVGLRLNVLPTGAPYVGLQIRPIPEITIGVTYRGPMYLNLAVPATIRASALALDIAIPIQVQGLGWYTPRQLAVGVSGNLTRDLTVTADVTYYNWSALASTYYPFLAISPQRGYESGVAGQLGFPRMGPPGWRDVWVPRIGGELRVMDSRIAIRGGYAFRPAALPLPSASTMLSNDGMTQIPNSVNLLDANTHSISIGGGYSFGSRPFERDVEAAPSETPPDGTEAPLALVLPYDADGFELEPQRGAQTRTASGRASRVPAPTTPTPIAAPPPPSPVRAAPVGAPSSPTAAAPAGETPVDPSLEDERDPNLPGITGQIDFLFRASLLQERVDALRDISYGGSIYDVGIQLTLGWY